MMDLLAHFFQFAEVYTVLLVWLVVPLGFLAILLFLQSQYGIFTLDGGVSNHGADRQVPENRS